MQFPESWLREFCDPPIGTAELADRLTMAGLEVEELRPVAPPFRGVVVGHVLSVDKHPNADRLRVCEVDAGTGETLRIVCGAPNVRAGMKAPVALVGAELPPAEGGTGADGESFRIRLGQIRGIESQGMLCSARELKLSEDHEGLLVLDDDARVGVDLREHLALDDTLFTLKLTPNLGHALSVFGVAREVAAITGAPLKAPTIRPAEVGAPTRLPVRIEAPDLCGRFSGRVIHDVDTRARTPRWMAERLARCGQRTVAPLVDISNYVMFELGRPSHIFDLDQIEGSLHVRWGHPGESLELLNGSTVEVDATVGVIADDARVESLAGIMGGHATAVSDATRNVYVEAAFWWPEAIAGRSRRFNFSTDAGHRFERGVDPATTVEHIERLTGLIVSICGGSQTRCGPVDDQIVDVPRPASVALRVERAAKVIGMPVTAAQCEHVMSRLGFEWTRRGGTIDVVPPSWRFDLRIEEDLIEEVIRLIGYDALPAATASGRLAARVDSERRRGPSALRHALAARGWQETISFSFVDERWERDFAGNEAPVRVVNPIAASYSVMRSSLVGSLVEVLRVNVARRATRLRVFELGKVYLRDPAAAKGELSVDGIRQPLRLGGLAFGPAEPVQWGMPERQVDVFDVKGDIESLVHPAPARFVPASHPALHPGRSAAIEIGGVRAGWLGELHPRWRQAYELPSSPIVFELDADVLMQRALPVFAPLPKQQPAWRDIAVVARGDVSHAALMEVIAAGGGSAVRSATLFDIYEPKNPGAGIGEGERSLAVRLEVRDDAQTLTDDRIDAVVGGVLAALERDLGVRLRKQGD
ncbi:MAG TPA: phenylalanine--tRNA ligase subunit beta [Caldimonas sp.]|jgi:phenylalanyl-tRNA synthetase beta chain|nr:phenylalanine--tRNA ligase subunit beta [Caldimonas sp.]HEX2541809.1 phenylalanine--tRNA ligase subunit beta [Caldimonas sp.]